MIAFHFKNMYLENLIIKLIMVPVEPFEKYCQPIDVLNIDD